MKIDFSGRVLIVGCGAVAQCVLAIIFKTTNIQPHNITVLDFVDNRHKIPDALAAGVRYSIEKITPDNYAELLKKYVQEGDIFLDLSVNVDTYSLMSWAYEHGVLYINTALEEWLPTEDTSREHIEMTLYARQQNVHKLVQSWADAHGPTMVIEHGANPGLISHFVKQGLVDRAHYFLKNSYTGAHALEVEKALADKNFAQLARSTQAYVIHVSERDTQITRDPKKVNEFVNTWSVDGLLEEGSAPSEISWGTHEGPLPATGIACGSAATGHICLTSMGMNTWARSWVPSGPIIGMIIRHGEVYSIGNALTVREGNAMVFRPTVHYVYCVCDGTLASLHEFRMHNNKQQPTQRILSNDIISGVDELGCLIMGPGCTTWWTGSVLSIEHARVLAPGQNATTVQVAIGVIAALGYCVENPRKGFLFPDDIDYQYVLKIARPYLGDFISKAVPEYPEVCHKNNVQFKNFFVGSL